MSRYEIKNDLVTFVSGVHDYRTKRRGSIQLLADGCKANGENVCFISIRFSLLSILKKDHRRKVWRTANRLETTDGVLCYLWMTPLHPFDLGLKVLRPITNLLHRMYGWLPNGHIDDIIRRSKVVIIESGHGIILIDRINKINPNCRIAYRASDELSTVNAHSYLQNELERSVGVLDHVFLLAQGMTGSFLWAFPDLSLLPQGQEAIDLDVGSSNPFPTGRNAVTAGSMLLDKDFFRVAASLFPDIQFHLIGTGERFAAPVNVSFYDEMSLSDYLNYARYADFGVAAYRNAPNVDYIADSSMKLFQFGSLGRPAVCPEFAVGTHPGRFGYKVGDSNTIRSSIQAALESPAFVGKAQPSWQALSALLIRRLTTAKPDDFRQSIAIGDVASLKRRSGTSVAISLVVCTINREAPLLKLLRSLAVQTCKNFEVIIVDQNTEDNLGKLIAGFRSCLDISYVRSMPGLSLGRNIGLYSAVGDIVGFPDDDCWYDYNVVQNVVDFFELSNGYSGLTGRTIDESDFPSLSHFRPRSCLVCKSNVFDCGNSNTMFFSRTAVASVGGFNPDLGVGASSIFRSGEETDLLLRLLMGGHRVMFCYRFTVRHPQIGRLSSVSKLARARTYAPGFGWILSRHGYGIYYFIYRSSRTIFAMLRALVCGDLVEVRYRYIWLLGSTRGYFRR